MSHTHFAVYQHIVFSTKNRQPHLSPAFEKELHPYLAAAINNQGCRALTVGGHREHIHAQVSMGKAILTSDLVKEIKRTSSVWAKGKTPELREFAWQEGYGAFSVSYSNIEQVREHIAHQATHHGQMSWEDEYRALLDRHGVEYDKRFFLG